MSEVPNIPSNPRSRSTRREYDLAIRGLDTALHRMRAAEAGLKSARKRVREAKEAHDQWLANRQKPPSFSPNFDERNGVR